VVQLVNCGARRKGCRVRQRRAWPAPRKPRGRLRRAADRGGRAARFAAGWVPYSPDCQPLVPFLSKCMRQRSVP
jgi:hypothetical protein